MVKVILRTGTERLQGKVGIARAVYPWLFFTDCSGAPVEAPKIVALRARDVG